MTAQLSQGFWANWPESKRLALATSDRSLFPHHQRKGYRLRFIGHTWQASRIAKKRQWVAKGGITTQSRICSIDAIWRFSLIFHPCLSVTLKKFEFKFWKASVVSREIANDKTLHVAGTRYYTPFLVSSFSLKSNRYQPNYGWLMCDQWLYLIKKSAMAD